MKLFILISHYAKLAQTIKEYLELMLPKDEQKVKIVALGGINEGKDLGTEPMTILETINENNDIQEIIIFSDLGSATLAAQSIASMVLNKKIHVSKGTFVENALSAYILANAGAEFQAVVDASEETIFK